jgi:hypothetical protein
VRGQQNNLISGKDNLWNYRLEGGYWTGRKTTGDIEMHFWKKERIDSYPKEIGRHPISEVRENKR